MIWMGDAIDIEREGGLRSLASIRNECQWWWWAQNDVIDRMPSAEICSQYRNRIIALVRVCFSSVMRS